MQDAVTVQATATVTVSGSPQTVVASNQANFVKPKVAQFQPAIAEYNNFAINNNNTSSQLGATETWSNIQITMPNGFSTGTCCFAQIIKSTSRTDAKPTGTYTTYTEKVQNSSGNWVVIPAPCLDSNFPYPFSSSWYVGSTGSGIDNPYFQVAPPLVPGDTGTWMNASGKDQFTTWIMYNPNVQNSADIWVPLESFDWNWSDTAQFQPTDLPPSWEPSSLLAPSDAGSDYAPSNTWPTWTTYALFGNGAMRP